MNNILLIDNNYTDCTESSYLFNKVKSFFVLNKYNIVNTEYDSQHILINTCGVWEDIEVRYINYINELLLKYGNTKKIYIFGCLSGISNILNRNKNIIIIPTKREILLDNYFYHDISIKNITSKEINNFSITNPSNRFGIESKRFYINISRGCIHKCSYCIIKKAIGYVSSRDMKEIIDECKYAINNGYDELILVSDDAASYGLDIGLSFDILFNNICCIVGNYKIDINYVEPGAFNKIFPKIKNNFYKVSSITCPIQSYNDRILVLMNRIYTVELYCNLIQGFREYGNNELKIINHIIYNYPTETYDEFKNNIRFLKICDNNLFNFYSYRKGTKIFNDNDIVNTIDKKNRLEILLKLNKLDNILVDLANIYD